MKQTKVFLLAMGVILAAIFFAASPAGAAIGDPCSDGYALGYCQNGIWYDQCPDGGTYLPGGDSGCYQSTFNSEYCCTGWTPPPPSTDPIDQTCSANGGACQDGNIFGGMWSGDSGYCPDGGYLMEGQCPSGQYCCTIPVTTSPTTGGGGDSWNCDACIWENIPTGGACGYSCSGSVASGVCQGTGTSRTCVSSPPLSEPDNFSASSQPGTGRVSLTWSLPTYSAPLANYRLYRGDTGLVATLGANVTSYTQTVDMGYRYSYRLFSVDAAGNEGSYAAIVYVDVAEGTGTTGDGGLPIAPTTSGSGTTGTTGTTGSGMTGTGTTGGGITNIGSIEFPDDTGLSEKPVALILVNLIKWALSIFAMLALIAFVISGSQYLLSAGSERVIDNAKRHMVWSIVGIIVALSGVIIVRTIDLILQARIN